MNTEMKEFLMQLSEADAAVLFENAVNEAKNVKKNWQTNQIGESKLYKKVLFIKNTEGYQTLSQCILGICEIARSGMIIPLEQLKFCLYSNKFRADNPGIAFPDVDPSRP
jgi:hypothetical protein